MSRDSLRGFAHSGLLATIDQRLPRAQPVVIRDGSLAPFNTFGLSAVAAERWLIDSLEGLEAWRATTDDRRPIILGGGSNVLFVLERIERPILHIRLRGRCVLDTDGEWALVEAAAGESWHDFVLWSLEQGLSGLENLSLIPGTVGAAPVQNIGAYGVELMHTCEAVECFDLIDGTCRWLSRDECAFGYRDSVFKHLPPDRWVITRVRFRLSRRFEPVLGYGELRAELTRAGVKAPTASDVSKAVCAIRRRKLPDPATIGNAGSFFKNPIVEVAVADRLSAAYPDCPRFPVPDGRVKLAAGWLIERAGWKGHRRGAAGVHEAHALVLVNHGGASGADIWRLAEDIRDDVAAKFGVRLEPEPRVIDG
ncbi:MAG: UDP-N-acetylmuramate dehydrogenase [Casimicrobiaceae bacterium]